MGAEAAFGGSILSGGAQLYGNAKEASAYRKNAAAVDQERKNTAQVFERKLYLLQRQQDKYTGSVESAFARSGIDFSGSQLDLYVDNQREQSLERSALLAEARQTDNHLASQASMLRDRASNLTSGFTTATTLLGTGIDATSSYYRAKGAGA